MQTVDIVVPAYNEVDSIRPLYERVFSAVEGAVGPESRHDRPFVALAAADGPQRPDQSGASSTPIAPHPSTLAI